MVTKYGNDENFSLQVRCLKALAYVRPEKVAKYYSKLRRTFEDEDIIKLATWFEANYVYNARKYPPEFWTIFDCEYSQKYPKTTNNVESWHRRLSVVVGRKKSGLYKIVEHLKGELIYSQNIVSKIQNGEKLKKNKRNVKKKNISRIVKKFNRLRKLEYLKRIAKNLVYN